MNMQTRDMADSAAPAGRVANNVSMPVYTLVREKSCKDLFNFYAQNRNNFVDLRNSEDYERAVSLQRAYTIRNEYNEICAAAIAWPHTLSDNQTATEIGSVLAIETGLGLAQILLTCLIVNCAEESPDFMDGNHPVFSHIYHGNVESERLFQSEPLNFKRFSSDKADLVAQFISARGGTIQHQSKEDGIDEFYEFRPKDILKIFGHIRDIRAQKFLVANDVGVHRAVQMDLSVWDHQSAKIKKRIA